MKIFNNDFGIWNPCVIYEAWTLHMPCFKSKFGPPSCQVIVEIYWKGIFVLSKSFNDFFTSLSITTDFVRLLRNFMMTVSGWTSSLSVWAAGGVGSLFGGPLLFGSRWVISISCSWIGSWISRSSLKSVRSLFSSVPGPVSLRPWTLMDPLRVHCSISSILSCRAMMVDCWLAIMSSRFLSSSLSTWIVLVPMVSQISLQLGLKMSWNFFYDKEMRLECCIIHDNARCICGPQGRACNDGHEWLHSTKDPRVASHDSVSTPTAITDQGSHGSLSTHWQGPQSVDNIWQKLHSSFTVEKQYQFIISLPFGSMDLHKAAWWFLDSSTH